MSVCVQSTHCYLFTCCDARSFDSSHQLFAFSVKQFVIGWSLSSVSVPPINQRCRRRAFYSVTVPLTILAGERELGSPSTHGKSIWVDDFRRDGQSFLVRYIEVQLWREILLLFVYGLFYVTCKLIILFKHLLLYLPLSPVFTSHVVKFSKKNPTFCSHGVFVSFAWFSECGEFYALYSSPNIFLVIKSKRISWSGHVARMGERRGTYRVLVGTSEGRRLLGRPSG
jgi:hypothetical protein